MNPYDQGGYFIINGKEKVILSQESKVTNVLYINKTSDPKIPIQANIKSVSKEDFNHLELMSLVIKQADPLKKVRIQCID